MAYVFFLFDSTCQNRNNWQNCSYCLLYLHSVVLWHRTKASYKSVQAHLLCWKHISKMIVVRTLLRLQALFLFGVYARWCCQSNAWSFLFSVLATVYPGRFLCVPKQYYCCGWSKHTSFLLYFETHWGWNIFTVDLTAALWECCSWAGAGDDCF